MVVLFNVGFYMLNFNLNGIVFNKLIDEEKIKWCVNKYYLELFYYIKKGCVVDYIWCDGVKIFLDLGVFFVFMFGIIVDMGYYCDFIYCNDDIIL